MPCSKRVRCQVRPSSNARLAASASAWKLSAHGLLSRFGWEWAARNSRTRARNAACSGESTDGASSMVLVTGASVLRPLRQAVELGAVLPEDLGLLFFTEGREPLVGECLRVGPRGLGVRVVARPHDVV